MNASGEQAPGESPIEIPNRAEGRPDEPVLRDLLVVTRHYAPEPIGSGPVMQEMAEWLTTKGRSVRVLTVRPSYPGSKVFDGYRRGERDKAVEGDVQVTRIATHPIAGDGLLRRVIPEARFLVDVVFASMSGRVARAHRVISLCPSVLTPLGAMAMTLRGGRHLVIVHDVPSGLGAALGSRWLRWVLPPLRMVEVFAFNHADHIIVLSAEMGEALRRLGVRRAITVLPPHLDTRSITPRPRQVAGPPTVLYSGNIGRKQGMEQLIELAAVLLRRACDVRVVIRGAGSMRESVAEQIAQRRLVNVELRPLAPKADLSEVLAEGDVHLVPQAAGGGDFAVPSKVFSIMAAGRPFVATGEPGSPLHALCVATRASVCVAPGSAEDFATAVLTLLADEPRQRAMGDAGRAYVEREADTEVVMERLLAALDG